MGPLWENISYPHRNTTWPVAVVLDEWVTRRLWFEGLQASLFPHALIQPIVWKQRVAMGQSTW